MRGSRWDEIPSVTCIVVCKHNEHSKRRILGAFIALRKCVEIAREPGSEKKYVFMMLLRIPNRLKESWLKLDSLKPRREAAMNPVINVDVSNLIF